MFATRTASTRSMVSMQSAGAAQRAPARRLTTRALPEEPHHRPCHPEDEPCEVTEAWNGTHLPSLQERIQRIKEAQALHYLQHRYTPTEVHDVVEGGLQSRPDLRGSPGADIHAWHEQQWAKLRHQLDGEH